MRMKTILMGSLVLASACSAADGDALARLRALGAASQCRQSSDCRTVPVGVRACGGPASYLAVARDDEAAALALARRHAAQRREEMARTPEPPSTCEVIRDPGAQCVAGRCVAGNTALPTE
jgi:hypothetical protein